MSSNVQAVIIKLDKNKSIQIALLARDHITITEFFLDKDGADKNKKQTRNKTKRGIPDNFATSDGSDGASIFQMLENA